MTGTRLCRTCGAVVPGRIGRCPACGAWAGLGLVAARLAGTLAAIVAVGALVWAVCARPGPSPGMTVLVTGVSRLSADARGTDVLGTIDNPNAVPVDVTVRVRGYDVSDRAVMEKTIGPYHGVPPGRPYPIRTYLDATPFQSVTLEAVDVRPFNTAGP